MDRQAMERAVADFLDAVGERFRGDDLEATPARVARAWSEDLLSGYGVDPGAAMSWTELDEEAAGPVLVQNVRFASVCVHHLLPFFGRAHVAYLPGRRLAGLSKFGRVIDGWARRMQIQERLTQSILDTVVETLEPRGALVVLQAEHTCMTLRGVRKEQSQLTTLAAAGGYDRDPAARREVLGLLLPPAGDAGDGD